MASNAVGYSSPHMSPSSPMSSGRSPDTASPVYPERAIRPLPKSRLKSRLSPEQATTIRYPPDPPPLSPTLHFSAILDNSEVAADRLPNGGANGHLHHQHHHHHETLDGPVHKHCSCCGDADSGDEEVEFDHPDYRYTPTTGQATYGGKSIDSVVQRRILEASRVPGKTHPAGSNESSADGYESFENTSNKKKRKIPVSSNSSMHQSQLSAEMASMGIGPPDKGHDDHASTANAPVPQYPSTAGTLTSGTGISGAGRGRYGRHAVKHERRGLVNSIHSVNGHDTRLPKSGRSDKPSENGDGIISQAIKSAAEQGPITPPKGRDSISLLHSAATTTTPKTQFTFACESESATKMADQQAASAAAAAAAAASAHGQGGKGVHPNNAIPPSGHVRPPPPPPPPPAANGHPPAPSSNSAPKPRPRRRPSKEFALAARQRRLQQEYTNYHQRPSQGDMYICEFCEYEDIFGVPPVALIRSYEIRDRAERKKAAEKRRLLEKAKLKNRKGKKTKGGKHGSNQASTPSATGNGADHAAYDPNLPPGADGDEYYDDDEYGDEYEPLDDQYNDTAADPGYYSPTSARSNPVAPPVTGRPGAKAPS